jgi:hypothetical protein
MEDVIKHILHETSGLTPPFSPFKEEGELVPMKEYFCFSQIMVYF